MNKSQKSEDENSLSLLHFIYVRLIKTMKNTTKADKYARLSANVVKLVRTSTPQAKTKYSKLYKQLLVLRQIFRWHGLYEAILQIKVKGWKLFELDNLSNVAFIIFQMFADFLDRIMFIIEILDLKQYQNFYNRIEQIQSDCYFIQCFIWLLYYLRTLPKILRQGIYEKKKMYILKILKYILDSMTSYCKFSKRIWQLQPKNAAVLGIASSMIGMYQLMQ